MQAPRIDQRAYPDVVAQTQQLAQQLSGWTPPPGAPDGPGDAGHALIGVFGRFAELVIDRLNRAPDKNYLAFLNLIGASPVPPRPARVPLTFQLAAGSPVDAVVPAGSRAAAPPAGGTGDVTFETERPLVVTRAQLRAAFVSDPRDDTYSDRTAQATDPASQPFGVFAGDQASPHQLYLACDPVLTEPGVKAVTLTLTSADTWQWQTWPVSWARWDGARWAEVAASAAVRDGAWVVTLPALPPVSATVINGCEAGWLRAQLGLPLPPGRSSLVPEAVAIGAASPGDLTLPLSPFPAGNTVRQFYLSADDAFGVAGARVTIQVQLAQPVTGASVELSWFYQAGQTDTGWQPLGQSAATPGQAPGPGFDFHDGTMAFTQSGEISFRVPMSWPRTLNNNRTGRWLRVQASGPYPTAPEISGLTVSYDWLLPQLGEITITAEPGPTAPPAAALCARQISAGTDVYSQIDPSQDFYPLGPQPQTGDAFYLACPAALASPVGTITLSVTLANPAGSTQWPPGGPAAGLRRRQPEHRLDGAERPGLAVHLGGVQLHRRRPGQHRPARSLHPVHGQRPAGLLAAGAADRRRLRQAGQLYADRQYLHVPPATLAPPIVKAITITAGAGPAVPVTACLSYNDFGYADHTAAASNTAPAGGGQGAPFAPFTPTSDPDPALYLGFDQGFSPTPVTMFLAVEPPRPDQVTAELDPAADAQTTWEYAAGAGWQPLGAVDETQDLSSPGLVTFPGPAGLARRSCFGQAWYWLRLRWPGGTFPLPPQLRSVLPNTTWAGQVTTVTSEILGSGNGTPGQSLTAAQTPVQPGQQLVVREPQLPVPAEEQALAQAEGPDAVTVVPGAAGQPDEVWVRWHAVPDFYASGPRDRHYTADPMSGVIAFGDGTDGMIPPQGQNNIRMTYRAGGGEQGNQDTATIVELKSSIPSVDSVTNYQRAQGGAPAEPVDRVQARGPRVLRHRDRAVAAQDLEDLAAAASADVAIAAAISPVFDPFSLWADPAGTGTGTATGTAAAAAGQLLEPGRMGVIIVPDEPGSARPVPSLGLLGQVRDYLAERCPPTADLWVAGPEWISVTVQATLVATSVGQAGPAGDQARAALARYLHPLTGGPAARGGGSAGGRAPRTCPRCWKPSRAWTMSAPWPCSTSPRSSRTSPRPQVSSFRTSSSGTS